MTASSASPGPASGAPRPEQVFFEDPALDRMMGVLLALATEHCVLRDRLKAVESRLATSGVLDPSALDAASVPSADDRQETAAFVEALLRPLLGVQQANGATGAFSLAGRRA
jgi:hypothetical protein